MTVTVLATNVLGIGSYDASRAITPPPIPAPEPAMIVEVPGAVGVNVVEYNTTEVPGGSVFPGEAAVIPEDPVVDEYPAEGVPAATVSGVDEIGGGNEPPPYASTMVIPTGIRDSNAGNAEMGVVVVIMPEDDNTAPESLKDNSAPVIRMEGVRGDTPSSVNTRSTGKGTPTAKECVVSMAGVLGSRSTLTISPPTAEWGMTNRITAKTPI